MSDEKEQSKPEDVPPETKKPEREFPCESCETGEYKLEASIPSNAGTTMVYKCDSCGHEVRFP